MPNEPGILTKEQLDFIRYNNDSKNLSGEILSDKDRMVNFLLEEERIKLNCDYAVALKYGEVHIMSHEVYAETIKEAAAFFGVSITSFHTWS